jgi:hypothetical protein
MPLVTPPTSIVSNVPFSLQGGRFLVVENSFEDRVIGPFELNGAVNDYEPAGLETADTIIVWTTGVPELTGIKAPSGTRRSVKKIVFMEQTSSHPSINLMEFDSRSFPENRFNSNGNGSNVVLSQGGHVVIVYNFVGLSWDVFTATTGSLVETNFSLTADAVPLTFFGVISTDLIRVTASAPGFKIKGVDSTFLGTPPIATTKETKIIYNVGVNSFTVTHNDPGVASNERILIPGAADVLLQPGDSLTILFEFANETWKVIG